MTIHSSPGNIHGIPPLPADAPAWERIKRPNTTQWHLGDVVKVSKTGMTGVITHVGSVPFMGTEVERSYMLDTTWTFHGYQLEWAQ